MLSLANIYTLYFRLYFRLCICLNKLSINRVLPILLNILNYVYLIAIKYSRNTTNLENKINDLIN